VPGSSAAPPGLSEHDPAGLAHYLLSFRWPWRDRDADCQAVDDGLPLWRQILALVPQPAARGRALEIGSPPFHVTLLLQRLRNYDMTLTAYATDGRTHMSHELDSPEYGEHYTFRCTCFDIERDPFPYPDGAFDLVIWCEVIEHLTENPVHALGEIHRVLRPGGQLVVSTPNVTRCGNITGLLRGRNIYDPYHLGTPLGGSRHSREYTLRELRDLVAGCGFSVERAEARDLTPPAGVAQRLFRTFMYRMVTSLTGATYQAHLFLRAVRTTAQPRAHFPPWLFAPAHLMLHSAPLGTRVVMGENDGGHTTFGWDAVRSDPSGVRWRRAADTADVYLLSAGPLRRVTVTLARGRGEVQVWHDSPGEPAVLLSSTAFEAGDEWCDVDVRLSTDYEPGRRLHVRFDVPGGVDVRTVAAHQSI